MKLSKLTILMTYVVATFPTIAVQAQSDQSDTCKPGYVWREAYHNNHVCVTPETLAQAVADNRQAGAHRQPGGGPSGPDTCRPSYVWR